MPFDKDTFFQFFTLASGISISLLQEDQEVVVRICFGSLTLIRSLIVYFIQLGSLTLHDGFADLRRILF